MKVFQKKKQISRKGAGILLAISFLGIGITTTSLTYISQATGYYGSTRSVVDGYRARELAQAGIEAGILTLHSLPEEYLFTLGLLSNPPRLLLSEDCNEDGKCIKYYVSYSIQPEDGKFNINLLIKNNDEISKEYYEIFSRLFDALDIELDTLGAIVDWIDENTFISTGGAEGHYYEGLRPPHKIKNAPFYSLSGLGLVKGFDRNLIFAHRVPVDFKENLEKLSSISAIEKQILQKDDWILSNNITAYITPGGLLGTEKVNVNAARYHVLLSLSGTMGRREILSIFKLKSKKGGYIKGTNDVKSIPELQIPAGLGALASRTLADYLLGSANVSGFLKTTSRFYRLAGIGFIAISSDTEERSLAVRRVWGIWDKQAKRFIYYSED